MSIEDDCLAGFTQFRRSTYLKLNVLGAIALRRFIEATVSRVFEVPDAELTRPTRGRPDAAFARQVAMYMAHVCCGVSLTDVGRMFERDRTTVAHACTVIEDSRDDPHFDLTLEFLEGTLRQSSQLSPLQPSHIATPL